jgi:hypothetical protein
MASLSDLFKSPANQYHMPAESEIRETVVPLANQMEVKRVNELLANLDFYAFGFDGTPHVGELFAIVVYYVKDWRVHNVLISVRHTDTALDTVKLAALLNDTLDDAGFERASLLSQVSVKSRKVLGISKDSVSVNHAALHHNRTRWSRAVVLDCMSHVTDRIGKRLTAPLAEEFVASLVALMAHSSNVGSFFNLRLIR